MADNNTIDPSKVSTGSPALGGCCYVSFKSGVLLPDTASEDIATGGNWESLGELSENGYTKSVSTNSNKFKGWHGSVLLSKISDEENTFKAEFTEIVRESVLKLRFGEDAIKYGTDNKVIDGIDPTTVPTAIHPMVFDELLDNNTKMRTVFPRAAIDSIDDEVHQRGSLLVYSITFTASVDDKGRPYYIRYATATAASASAGA